MNFLGPIEGMNFNPISNYNNFIKDSNSFDVDSSMEFENILSKQTAALQNPIKVQGSIEVNNFDAIMTQATDNAIDKNSPSGNFLKSISNSVNGGLSSVNSAMDAASKAQEAFAMGEDVSVHDVMIASEKASLSLQMAMQLRNKIMTAYNEINNVKV